MRPLALLIMMACTGALAAQTANLSGSVGSSTTHVYRVSVDYGSTPTTLALTLNAATTSAAGLDVELIDVEAQVQLVSNSVFIAQAGAGAGSVQLSAGPYSGVADFFLLVTTWDVGTSSYTASVSAPAPVTASASKSVNTGPSEVFEDLHQRVFYFYGDFNGGGNVSREFKINFGATPQSVSFAFDFFSWWGMNDISIFEKQPGGGEVLVFSSGSTFSGLVSVGTGTHTGIVTYRVQTGVPSGGSDIEWTVTVPRTVATAGHNGKSSSGGGTGGKLSPSSSNGGGGCTTDASGGFGMLVIVLAAGISLRRRRKSGERT
ncbi:MAG: hypothetical protein KF696_02035 [Planctomycetes bacterium]|nr:hypothetical protein [Planctomycetota bacterium]MCW8134781.1 hypothetical protein [Planctomycetota bacterium]